MTAKIDNVKKGERITAEAWNELVERVNALEKRQAFNFTVQQRPRAAKPLVVKPFRLRSYWTKAAGAVYTAQAIEIDPKTQANAQGAVLVDVYSVTGGAPPEGAPYSWLFYAVWNEERERWESLQQPQIKEPAISGDYITVYDYDSNRGGCAVNNEGVWFMQIPGDSYQSVKNTYFDKTFFKWIPSELDIVGKKDVSIRAHYENVVVGIVDGVPTMKRVLVLGDE